MQSFCILLGKKNVNFEYPEEYSMFKTLHLFIPQDYNYMKEFD